METRDAIVHGKLAKFTDWELQSAAASDRGSRHLVWLGQLSLLLFASLMLSASVVTYLGFTHMRNEDGSTDPRSTLLFSIGLVLLSSSSVAFVGALLRLLAAKGIPAGEGEIVRKYLRRHFGPDPCQVR